MSNKRGFSIPEEVLDKWQEILNVTADIMDVPAALIMKVNMPDIVVFKASKSEDNPYKPGDSEFLPGSGLYCENVINNRQKLKVVNALKDKKWCDNPDIKLNMISYLGYPLVWPDNDIFGTICVLDNKEREYEGKRADYFKKLKELVEMHLSLIQSNNKKTELLLEREEHLEKIKTFNRLCEDRELRVIELKKEVDFLLKEMGRPSRYGY